MNGICRSKKRQYNGKNVERDTRKILKQRNKVVLPRCKENTENRKGIPKEK